MAKRKTSRGRRMRRNAIAVHDAPTAQEILEMARRTLGWAEDSVRDGLREVATADRHSSALAFDAALTSAERLGEVMGLITSLIGDRNKPFHTMLAAVEMQNLLHDLRSVQGRHIQLMTTIRPEN